MQRIRFALRIYSEAALAFLFICFGLIELAIGLTFGALHGYSWFTSFFFIRASVFFIGALSFIAYVYPKVQRDFN